MKTCLRNCKIGDIIVWSEHNMHYKVTAPFNGDFVTGFDDSEKCEGVFYERYLDFPGCFIKIIKAK